ncbi:MAG: FmdB family zinc ribbon protein [Elusimicrobiota bacterium]
MPIYTYLCRRCSGEFERLENVCADEDELKCTLCGSIDVERQFSTFSVGRRGSSSSPSCSDSPYCSTCCPGKDSCNLH